MIHTPSQSDMDILNLLTSSPDGPSRYPFSSPPAQRSGESSSPLHAHPQLPAASSSNGKKREKDSNPIDALLISAVIAGSGKVSRHHFNHGFGGAQAYGSCDGVEPSSRSSAPSRPPPTMRSMQAPRSVRLKMEKEAEEKRQTEANVKASQSAMDIPSTSQSASSYREPSSLSTSLGGMSLDGREPRKPRRKMSIDPSPVSQTLQIASPSGQNFFHPPPPSIPSSLAGPSAARQSDQAQSSPAPTKPHSLRVRCMARTRIPTPHGDIFLHLYHNSQDTKEHLAIVFDPIQLDPEVRGAAPTGRKEIRSKSLDAVWREGETDMERVVRGAYIGRLAPGREDSASAPPRQRPVGDDVLDGLDVVDEEGEDMPEEDDILPLVRIHSECFTGETVGSMRCDCGEQLDEAMHLISQPQSVPTKHCHHLANHIDPSAPSTPGPSMPITRQASPSTTAVSTPQPSVPGRGVVIYLRQEGRGIGLLEKIRAYNLQDLGHDTVTANLMLGHRADERSYTVAAEILRDLGLGDSRGVSRGIRLLTNNPEKVEGLAKEGVRVVERVGMVPRDWRCPVNSPVRRHIPLEDEVEQEKEREYEDWRARRAGVGLIGAGRTRGPELEKYLRTKVEKMGHVIDLPTSSQ